MDTLALKRITVDRQGDVAVVTFVDRNILDEQQISVLGDEYYLLVHQFTKVLLDFSHVGYHSSGAFGKLIGLERLTRHSNIPLRLCSIPHSLHQTFKITALDQLFHIYRNQEEALRNWQ